MKIGIVGATGLVGQKIVKCLFEENLATGTEIVLFASEKNHGKVMVINSRELRVVKLDEKALEKNFDIVFFSAGEEVSREWAERFARRGAFVIDNSNAFRRIDAIPLVCPEINIDKINANTKIIANPNCSTIQLVIALNALLKYDIKKVVVSTYQSVSGAGRGALEDFYNGTNFEIKEGIRDNVIARIGGALPSGFCVEEDKIMFETSKILGKNLDVSATTMRVPVPFCHTESVYVKLGKEFDEAKIIGEFEQAGIKFDEDVSLPTKIAGTNEVHVCRLRKHGENELMFVLVADNLRRGAAYNAVKISAFIIKNILNLG